MVAQNTAEKEIDVGWIGHRKPGMDVNQQAARNVELGCMDVLDAGFTRLILVI